MKLYAVTILLAICIIQSTHADWREDLKKEHVDRLVKFVKGMEDLLQASVATKNTPAAWDCYNSASEKFANLISRHSSEVEQCVASPADEPQAIKCCDKLKRNMIKEASVVSSAASNCIDKS